MGAALSSDCVFGLDLSFGCFEIFELWMMGIMERWLKSLILAKCKQKRYAFSMLAIISRLFKRKRKKHFNLKRFSYTCLWIKVACTSKVHRRSRIFLSVHLIGCMHT